MTLLVLSGCGGGSSGGSGSGRGDDRRPLNDTGFVLCGDAATDEATGQNDIACGDAGAGTEIPGIDANGDYVPGGQDALYGRDVRARSAQGDAATGFSFTRVSQGGADLAGDATSWACVRDNVTGYVWEVRGDGGGLRDRDWTYTWFNSRGSENGGNGGMPDAGEGMGSDNCFNLSRCDTEKYVQDVNALRLCGQTGWRLPSADELRSLVHFGHASPALHVGYFPDSTTNRLYWTASPDADLATRAWAIDFYDGLEVLRGKGSPAAVRLVNIGKPRDVVYDVLGAR